MTDALIARVLGGVYRVDRRLGEGGMGAVYAARHLRTGREYAVKVLLPELASREAPLARFRREAHALASLGHAHIVAVHDFDRTEDGLAYLVMDRLEGEDLAARLRRGPIGIEPAIAIADGVASALEAAHAIGLVHRDLKPGNVFLARIPGAAERPVLLDFGLAKSLEIEPAQRITSTGVVMGTPHYMAPEQAQGGPIDARTDLYALGAIVFEAVSGQPPFDAPTLASLLVKILTSPPPSLRAHGPRADALDAIVRRCLAKDPADRFESASALRRALGAPSRTPATIMAPPSPLTRDSPPTGAPTARGAAVGRRAIPPRTDRSVGLAVAISLAAIALITALGLTAAIGIAVGTRLWTRQPPPPFAASIPFADAGIQVDSAASVSIDAFVEPDAGVLVASRRHEHARTRPTIVVPGGTDTSAPGFDQGMAARERVQAGEWAGCLRALEGSPPTLDLLWLRASCAHHAGDRATLERACATLTTRFPDAAQSRSCPALLSSLR